MPEAEKHDEVRDVPASRVSDVAEHERERGEDSPQADPAGGRGSRPAIIESVGANKMASWPTRRNWPKFRVREKTTIAATGPRSTRAAPSPPANRTRDRGRPEQRDRQDQHRDQHEQRLAGARVVVVLRIRADPRQRRKHSIADAPDPAHPAHSGDRTRNRCRLALRRRGGIDSQLRRGARTAEPLPTCRARSSRRSRTRSARRSSPRDSASSART